MGQTKGVEERLIAEAQNKQRLLEEGHKAELARFVQDLDARKAAQLKELEDGLQRQIQAALNTTKKDINGIETEMNNRKMQLMQQAQTQTAKDVDRLSALAVEAKLVPSTTRTIIETNTATGTVLAVAAGGSISTGQATAQSISQPNIVAKPAEGRVTQETDVTTGTLRRNDNDRAVGTGAIVDTMTSVTQRPQEGQVLSSTQNLGGTSATATSNAENAGDRNLSSGSRPITTTSVAPSTASLGPKPHIDAAYGRPVNSDLAKDSKIDPNATSYDKSQLQGDSASGTGKHESILSKVKHAITGEPKTSSANKNKV